MQMDLFCYVSHFHIYFGLAVPSAQEKELISV